MKVVIKYGFGELESNVCLSCRGAGRHKGWSLSASFVENGYDCTLVWTPSEYEDQHDKLSLFYDNGEEIQLWDTEDEAKEHAEWIRSNDDKASVGHIQSIRIAEMSLGVCISLRLNDLRNRWKAIQMLASLSTVL